jgi:hypothetical protein
MNKKRKINLIAILAVLLFGIGVVTITYSPRFQNKASQALTWMRGVISPAGAFPTVEAADGGSVEEKGFWLPDLMGTQPQSRTTNESLQSSHASVVKERSVRLTPPIFNSHRDYQDWNNCGPATLALALRYWGWQGDQFTISQEIRPKRQDKNVNVEELTGYVNQSVEGLQAEVRVGGNLETLKNLIAGGFPVVIEEAFKVEKSAWPGDDLWAGHYVLLTGFDEKTRLFTSQDSYYGPDRSISFDTLSADWQAFNHLYLVIFPKDDLQQIQTLLNDDWDVQTNLTRTVESLHVQLQSEPANAFAWFNLGSGLVAQQEYSSAVQAFAKARALGLPQRMLRYQFGPLIADYQTGDEKDLMRLADYALQITPDAEEVLLWKGWAYELKGDQLSAIDFFHKALEAHPGYLEAENALASLR